MDSPAWAQGPIRLIQHARSHRGSVRAVDNRLSFISIDNAVELLLRQYLSLSRASWRAKLTAAEIDQMPFPALIHHLANIGNGRIQGMPLDDIEYYHKKRNLLYHEGAGIGVDSEYIDSYYAIACSLLATIGRIDNIPDIPPTGNLRPEVRANLRSQILESQRATRKQKARERRKDTQPTKAGSGTFSDEEKSLIRQYYDQGWGYKRIAIELNKLRRKSRPRRAETEAAKVRRYVKRTGFSLAQLSDEADR